MIKPELDDEIGAQRVIGGIPRIKVIGVGGGGNNAVKCWILLPKYRNGSFK